MAIPELTQEKTTMTREEQQDTAIDIIIERQEQFRESIIRIVNNLNERIHALERDNDYIMKWRQAHDNEETNFEKKAYDNFKEIRYIFISNKRHFSDIEKRVSNLEKKKKR